MSTLTITECDCHPMPQFGPIKTRKLSYDQVIMGASFGTVTVILARPYKGSIDKGFFVKIFGTLYVLSLWRSKL